MSGRRATRAWLDMWKRVLKTRPRARDSRATSLPTDVVEEEHGNDKENLEFPKSPKFPHREF